MKQKTKACPSCGSAERKEIAKGRYRCAHCDTEYVEGLDVTDSEYIIKHTEKALWEQTVEQIEKILYNLDNEVHKEYINDREVVHWCRELKKLIPAHFMAEFYEKAVGNDKRALSEYLGNIDVENHYDDIEEVLRFAIKLLKPETLLAVSNLIIRAYENRDIAKFGEWNEKFSKTAKKVEDGVFDVMLSRDVFVAYKSEDMKKVEELVSYLEDDEGLSCFVAARNIQHGKIGDYTELLKTAMKNCSVLVFVSSKRSRKTGDARNVELKNLRDEELDNGPPEYRAKNDYKGLPKKYKKPRVEYVIEEYTNAVAERFVAEFFNGYERQTKIEDVAARIFEQLDAPIETDVISSKVYSELEELRKKAEELERQKREAEQRAAQLEAEHNERERQAKEQEAEEAEGAKLQAQIDLTDFEIEDGVLVEYKGDGGDVIIPNSVTNIDGLAFKDCSELTSIEIPNSVTSIDGLAFYDCSGLTSINIPNSVTSIKGSAFSGCSGLKSITVQSGNRTYHSKNNCIIKTASKELVVGCKNSIIPADGSVTSIGEGAFSGCSGLTSITIPNSVTSIGNGAFRGCSSLTSIEMPNSVTSIGESAFSFCKNLTSVLIPNSVTSIGSEVFFFCYALAKIHYNGTKKQWDKVNKDYDWSDHTPVQLRVCCIDGEVDKWE